MKQLHKEGGRYALLLILLLAIATVAVIVILNYVETIIPADRQNDLHMLTALLWSLTMGFMLIAGAFGLWAIYFAAETESLRRLSHLVDGMSYIHDGVIALDNQGRLSGLNPTARELFGEHARGLHFTALPLQLSEDNIKSLKNPNYIAEFECLLNNDTPEPRTLRFRSQPGAAGISLILISDVTDMVNMLKQKRKAAYLQLAGHMARGVANDFNDLLCGISGHATLLKRPPSDSNRSTDIASVSAIQDCADRGIRLARQLIQLSSGNGSEGSNGVTFDALHHVKLGIDWLEASVDTTWSIIRHLPSTPVPPVNIPPSQIEHVIQSLGLLASEANLTDPVISISLTLPPAKSELKNTISSVLSISSLETDESTQLIRPVDTSDSGMIITMINTLMMQSGGQLEVFSSHGNRKRFDLYLPLADSLDHSFSKDSDSLATGLEGYVSGWTVIMGAARASHPSVRDLIDKTGLNVITSTGTVEFLSQVAETDKLDCVILDTQVSENDPDRIINILAKLHPDTGIILMGANADVTNAHAENLLLMDDPISIEDLLKGIIESRSRARDSHANA